MPQLLDLPPELLLALPLYLRNIEDFTNAASTCRTLRTIFADTHPNTILRLAAAAAPTFFSPHPHVLVLATARQLANWAMGNEERTAELRLAFQGGVEGLLEFAIPRTGLTLADIKELYNTRLDVMNVFSDKIDKMAGKQWYATPNFWDGGVSEPYTIDVEADSAAYQIAIYGELFGSTMEANLQRAAGREAPPGFDRQTRIEFIKYCIPEWIIDPGSEMGNLERNMALPVGPYAPGHERLPRGQFDLRYVVTCGRWRRMWQAGERALGPDCDSHTWPEWKDVLWASVVQQMGLMSLKLVTAPAEHEVDATAKEKFRELWALVDALNGLPSDVPRLAIDLTNCFGGM